MKVRPFALVSAAITSLIGGFLAAFGHELFKSSKDDIWRMPHFGVAMAGGAWSQVASAGTLGWGVIESGLDGLWRIGGWVEQGAEMAWRQVDGAGMWSRDAFLGMAQSVGHGLGRGWHWIEWVAHLLF